MSTIPTLITDAAITLSEDSGQPLASLSLDEVAAHAGISRATLFRRIGSRAALEDAVRQRGVNPGHRPDVRDRAVLAAASIVAERGLAALTLEAVSRAAECSVPALHTQLGGREGLLAAMFQRFSPLPRIETILSPPVPPFEEGVEALYTTAFDTAMAEPRVLPALMGDILIRPGGPSMGSMAATYLPRVLALLGGWLDEQVALGRCRDLPRPLMAQLLIGPMVAHVLSRPALERSEGVPTPSREEVISQLTSAYIRAVGLPSVVAQHD